MGDPKKTRKKYNKPKKRWDKARIEREKKLMQEYGLKNKKELYRFESMLRNKRATARRLLALSAEERLKREKELIQSLYRIGILPQNATLDDVLSLSLESFLERRLQTIVLRKGLARTIKQARQFIVHGHIALNGRKITAPSYIVKRGEEDKIDFFKEPLLLEPKKSKKIEKEKEKSEKDKLKEEFEEALPKEKAEEIKEEKVAEEVKA
ncbi:MAG: 30S ribosomal protein S4 [Candidatus Diapherotrites archaeon]|nr:30S ribosomal protein S4 [Candidatus Diapherotrites archaeon]